MKHQFDLQDNGKVLQVTIEPSVYQDKHLYEVHINGVYIILYQEGEEWKYNEEYELSPELLKQLIERVKTLQQNHSFPTLST